VEYYLSDANLQKDAFFYNKILGEDEGYLDLDLIMNCNKIKSLGVSKETIAQAIKNSKEVEVDADGKRIRRKGNKSLPEPKFKQKKLKTEDGQGVSVGDKLEPEQQGEESEQFIPIILFIKETSHLEKVIGKDFEQKLGEQLGIEVPFARIGKYDGNVVFDRSKLSKETLSKLLEKGFEYEGQKVDFTLGAHKDIGDFLRNHGRHVGKIIQKKYGKEMGKPQKDQQKRFKGKVQFLGVNYPTLESLKAVFKALIVKTKNGAVIDESGRSQLMELLKHHEKSEEKLKDAKDFTVGLHPEYKQTRCFFVIKNDGTQEDFSFHKCLTRLWERPQQRMTNFQYF